ncbi:MAG TPA: DUF998 domain-containing protein [Luteimonas sp.]|nr:DUF998 domain-containing protein [Luteimonas sp.]
MARRHFWITAAATLLALASVASSGWSIEGYQHRLHPVALPGARGVPGAAAFNLLAFVLPGLAVAWLAWSARGWASVGSGWPARLSLQCLLLAALAHGAQGMLPLDPTDLDAMASRLHAAAWTAWWLASVVALLFGAAAAWRGGIGRVPAAVLMAAAAAAMALLAVAELGALPAPVAQRLALALWFVAVLALSCRGAGPAPP